MKLRTLLGALVVISTLQLGLIWVQGAQLNRHQQSLQALHLDIQELVEVLDQNGMVGGGGEEGAWRPSRAQRTRGANLRRVRFQEKEEEASVKELKAAQESAQKAVKDARETQSKLSITEAAKRAEETRKIQAAQDQWVTWVWGGLGVVVVALLLRAWFRRR